MRSNWESLIRAVSAPLGFFVLALLITETYLGISLATAKNLSGDQEFKAITMGGLLFTLVVLLVTLLVWYKPEHLTHDSKALLKSQSQKKSWGTEKNRLSKDEEDELPSITPPSVAT